MSDMRCTQCHRPLPAWQRAAIENRLVAARRALLAAGMTDADINRALLGWAVFCSQACMDAWQAVPR
jgi:hypothetical protein